MTTLTSATPESPAQPPDKNTTKPWLTRYLMRLHFYAGVFIAPFIIVASLTGMLYAFAPDIDKAIHRDVLTVDAVTAPVSLQAQVDAATAYTGAEHGPMKVVPAASPTDATLVTFHDKSLAKGQSKGVYVNPADASITGDIVLEGRGGTMPFTKWLSTFHKNLHLGDVGVIYSELAASWLLIIGCGGLWLWARTRPRTKTVAKKGSRRRFRRLHVGVGLASLAGLLVLGATGVTWSEHAGENVREVRKAAGWVAPRLSATLPAGQGTSDHAGHATASADDILASAREAGINANTVALTYPMKPGMGIMVSETARTVPLERDKVVLDPHSLGVVKTQDFNDSPFMAKVVTWGILFHRGELFGLINQILLFMVGAAAIALSVIGYVMWWKRRPARASRYAFGRPSPRGALRDAPKWALALVAVGTVSVGWFLPTVGISLAAFVILDVLLGWRAQRTSK